MTTIQVTVDMSFDRLPDDAARELARELVEARGLTVSRVSVKAEANRVKAFVPKAYTPGAPVVANGRRYVVWSQGEHHRSTRLVDLWVTPEDHREGDATVYRYNGSTVRPYHGDGKLCATRWVTGVDFKRIEQPCQHASHAAERAA